MSATNTGQNHRHHLHAAHSGTSDPTQTKSLRDEYAQRLRGILARINAEMRRGIVKRDVFGLQSASVQAAREPDPLHDLSFESRADKIEEFREWLEEQERKGRVEVFTRGGNTYVRSAYERGIEHADQALQEAGIDTPNTAVGVVMQLPVHRDQLQTLYTRNVTEWDGITAAMNQQIIRELTDGLQQGRNPTDIARDISDRVEKVGKKRATDLARTEIIRSHADATLNRYEQAGVEEVVGEAEFQTAEDNKVCPICKSLNGKVYPIEEARGLIPVHPRCRCTFLPAAGDSTQSSLT